MPCAYCGIAHARVCADTCMERDYREAIAKRVRELNNEVVLFEEKKVKR